jgi:hypothetical protein
MLTKIYPSKLLTLGQETFLDYIIYLLPGLVHCLWVLHIRKPMFCLHYTCKSILMKIINNEISVLLNNIFCLTEMFQQVRFLRFVVFQSVYFKITSDHSK